MPSGEAPVDCCRFVGDYGKAKARFVSCTKDGVPSEGVGGEGGLGGRVFFFLLFVPFCFFF